MSPSLATTLVVYAAVLCGWATVDALRGRGRHRLLSASLIVLQAGIVLQALLAAFELLTDHRPGELAVYVGYLIASVLVVPVVLSAAVDERGVWQSAITALACLAVLIVTLRLHTVAGPRP